MMGKIIKIVLCFIVFFNCGRTFAEGSWNVVYDNFSISLGEIICMDSVNCYAIGNYGSSQPVIMESNDKGANWTVIFNGSTSSLPLQNINSFAHPTPGFITAVTDSGKLLITTDRGISWYFKKIENETNLSAIDMSDSLLGITASKDHLYLTKDGWNSWQEITNTPINDISSGKAYFKDVKILSPSTIIIKIQVASQPVKLEIFRTEDSCKTWSRYNFPSNCTGSWKFTDSLNGWCVGGDLLKEGSGLSSAKIAHTSDGGKSWIIQVNDSVYQPKYPLRDIDFVDNMNGVAVGISGKVLRTSNGGNSWELLPSDLVKADNPVTIHVAMADKKTILVTSYFGKIYKYSEPNDVPVEPSEPVPDDIYPNPATDILNIRNNGNNLIRIYSVIGSKIMESVNTGQIDVSSLAPGVYFLKIGDKVYKFVKI